MIIRQLFLIAIISAVLALSAHTKYAKAETRLALVIGNGEYQHHPALKNPINDAEAVLRVLKAAEFRVLDGRNLDKYQLENLFKEYLRELNDADVALLYYSGHAVQVGGENYLIPTGAKLQNDHDLELEAINLGTIRRYMEKRSRLQLIFLDACRDNPFIGRKFTYSASPTRSNETTRGLALVQAGAGSLIAFSTDPNSVASDGDGDLSPFTQAFVQHALTPAIDIREVMTRVRRDVRRLTNNRQTPWENSSLEGNFYFVPPRPAPVVEKLHKQAVAASIAETRLTAAAPHQPEGGDLDITFDTLPDTGFLSLSGKRLAMGASINAADWAKLSYHPAAANPGTVTLIGYTVADAWGNKVPGMIAMTLSGTPVGDKPPDGNARQTEEQISRYLGTLRTKLLGLAGKGLSPTIGVGPVPLNLGVGDLDNKTSVATRLLLTEVPANGTLRTGDRILLAGETATLKELERLTFEPIVGSEAKRLALKVEFVSASGLRSGLASVDLTPALNPCDVLAAGPFDLQGVASPGVNAAYIKAEKAREACLEAVASYPSVTRFLFQLARAEQAAGNTSQARSLFELAARKGHIRANWSLGMIYALGGQVEPDQDKATNYFSIGTEYGDPYAMHTLGKRMYRGVGIKEDRKKGLTLLLQAAEIGHTYSMNELGALFKRGEGVAKDPARSVRYYTDSAVRGDIYGYNNMGTLFESGFGVKKDHEQALHFYKRAHEGGHPYAGRNIGIMYLQGRGVEKSQTVAAFWYELSAERGDAWSAANRGWLALNGEASLRNPVEAARYYALASSLVQRVSDVKQKVTPATEAQKYFKKISKRQKQAALMEVLAELVDRKKLKTAKFDKAARALARKLLKRSGRKYSGVIETDLISLTRVLWLKKNPRFDLL